ncbi:MAG: hemolysin III family protein [Methylococcales bacterium]|jgi:hemolysin III|nr:hemolysin III family protein [Methylococcales bacterium]MBT7410877.1 hemolysin III family protein [Methylococcales bacterium]
MQNNSTCPISGQTIREEVVNTLSHALALLVSIIGIIMLIGYASHAGNSQYILYCSIYGATLILVYASSAIYHWVKSAHHKKFFQLCDHICIYLLIAGTYTPFMLIGLNNDLGWQLFALIWVLAGVGIIFKLVFKGRFELLSTLIYLGMGWVCLFAIEPLYQNLSTLEFNLLVIGGVTYSVGTIFFIVEKIPFNHAIWHLFVFGGSACHYFSIVSFVLPEAQV